MTTFTTEDRKALEKGLEFFASVKQSSPPHIIDSGASVDKEDREQMLRDQIHIMQAEIQRLKKKLMDAGIYE